MLTFTDPWVLVEFDVLLELHEASTRAADNVHTQRKRALVLFFLGIMIVLDLLRLVRHGVALRL
jgi:hypothetical protein